jgi:dolichyl-phosphate beta-glucosyltransferase
MTLEWLNEDPDDPRPTLSVVLPAYRAADILARQVPVLTAYLEQTGLRHEVLVCDDGSGDGGATLRLARALGCRAVGHEVNRGKGAAVRTGILAARGRYRLFTDADLPFELAAIERALYYLAFKEFDVVAGDRTLTDSHYYTDVTRARRVASQVFAGVTGRLVTGGFFDTQCGFKAFRAGVAEDLFGVARVDRFAGDVEVLYVALKRNYDIKRLPVHLRNQDPSSVRIMRDGARMLWDLLRIRYHQLRGHYAPVNAAAPASPEGARRGPSAAEPPPLRDSRTT